jgi:Hint domain
MAIDPRANYEFMYNVTLNPDGTYTLNQGSPAATTVKFHSPDTDITSGQDIHLRSAGHGLNGDYDYVGSVATSQGGTGYIVQNAVTDQTYMLTDQRFIFAGNPDRSLGDANTGSDMPVCFMAGTRVSTPSGEINVENLKVGDMVLTADGRPVPVRWIGRQTVAPLFAGELSLPVRIKAGALDEQVPSRDLMVSHDHALFVDGILIQAGALINGTSIVRERDVPKTFVYYHVEVEDHSLILAENVPAETFVDNVDRARFDNWSEHEALYPEGKNIEEMPHPRAKAHRQVPVNVRVKLAERAEAISGVAAVA